MKRLAAVLVLAVVASLAAATPATASDRQVQLSTDGTTWSHALPVPLFDSGLRWVPGDRRVATFHVRNGGDTPAELSLAGVGDDGDNLLADGLLVIRARTDAGEWTHVHDLDDEHELTDVAVPPSSSTRVEVAVELTADAVNVSMDRTMPLDFRVRLTHGVAISVNGTDDGTDVSAGSSTTDGVLPATGAPETGMTLLVAGTLIGMGLALVAARRRRDDQGASHVTA